MSKYVVYVQNEDSTLLQTDDYVNTCESYVDVVRLALEYIQEDQEFYGWSDDTIQKMLAELANEGRFDMHNGRSFYTVKWDGKEDPLAVARKHDERFVS